MRGKVFSKKKIFNTSTHAQSADVAKWRWFDELALCLGTAGYYWGDSMVWGVLKWGTFEWGWTVCVCAQLLVLMWICWFVMPKSFCMNCCVKLFCWGK
jgi:hypothetical protein